MIINVRGTHGSGKSTIAKKFLQRYSWVQLPLSTTRRPEAYRVKVRNLEIPLYLIGSYENACGGADAIQPYSDIMPRVLWYAKRGHVLFEGALVSSCHGSLIDSLDRVKAQVVIPFLDTPMEVCLERIAKRRAAKGNLTPLNPKNTQSKFDFCQRSFTTLAERGFDVRWINYQRAFFSVLEILKEVR